jgi:predicted TIM-barrel fold metal-dependent hydrolase
LSDLVDLARSFPETKIIVNHAGSPVGVGRHAGKLDEEYPQWKRDMAALAGCPNVVVKLGGLGSYLLGSTFYRAATPPSEEALIADWKPYIEPTIELFGPDRCMFESNLPTDGSGSFRTVCNAFKRMTAQCSPAERGEIFAGTAARTYRLDLAALRQASQANC